MARSRQRQDSDEPERKRTAESDVAKRRRIDAIIERASADAPTAGPGDVRDDAARGVWLEVGRREAGDGRAVGRDARRQVDESIRRAELRRERPSPRELDPEEGRLLSRAAESKVLRDYGPHLSPEARAVAKGMEVHVQPDAAFRADLREKLRARHPELPDEALADMVERTHGYVEPGEPGKPVFLNAARRRPMETLVHEELHRVSSDAVRRQMGDGIAEGMTEYFARRSFAAEVRDTDAVLDPATHRLLRLDDVTPRFYVEERQLVEMMAARAGEEPLARAYFGGDLGPLRESLDGDLGGGAFERLTEILRQAEARGASDGERRAAYDRARALLGDVGE